MDHDIEEINAHGNVIGQKKETASPNQEPIPPQRK